MTSQIPFYDNFRFTHARHPIIRLVRNSAGSTMPVSTSDMKDHLNIVGNSWDTYIGLLIGAATRYAEEYCGVSFTGSTYTQYQSHWQRENNIWYPTLDEISSVTYYDTENTQQTLTVGTDIFLLNQVDRQSQLFFAYPQIIPFTACRPDAVAIAFTTTATAPETLVMAIKLIVGTWFDRRANEQEVKLNEVCIGAKALLDQLKVSPLC